LSIDCSHSKDQSEAWLETLKRKIYAQRRQNKSMHDAIAARLPSFQHELRPRTKSDDSRSLIAHYDQLLEEAAFLERYMAMLECVGESQNESDSFAFLIDGWRKGCGLESCEEMMDRLGKNIRFVRQGIETVAAKQPNS
jgi:hypothetical protein